MLYAALCRSPRATISKCLMHFIHYLMVCSVGLVLRCSRLHAVLYCIVLYCHICCVQGPEGQAPVMKKIRGEMKDLERCSISGEAVPQVVAETSVSTPASASSNRVAVEDTGRRASLKAQAGALYRKNAVYQRRNMCSNVCLLSAPIFFCLMLLAVQIAINRLLLTGADFEVG